MFVPVCPYVDLFLLFRGKHNKIRIFHFPREWSLEAYAYIAREWRQIGQAYATTISVTLVGTLLGVFMTMTLAYLISRRDLPGRKFLNIFVIVTMLYNGGLVPTYIMYTNYFHIKNTYMALLIPSLMLNAFTS